MLQRIWEDNPDWRFGQLLSNVCNSYDGYFRLIEDTVLEKELRDYLEKH